jgi:hypothetical protein
MRLQALQEQHSQKATTKTEKNIVVSSPAVKSNPNYFDFR